MSETTTTTEQQQPTVTPQEPVAQETTAAEHAPEAAHGTPEPTTPVSENTQAQNVDPILSERQKFLEKFSAFYLEHGTIEPVIKAYSVDYDKLSPEELLRLDLKERYPGLSDDRFEKLYQKQVVEKYSLDQDLFDKEDFELGRELATRDSEPIRQRLKDKASEWLAPKVSHEEQQKAYEKEVENWNKTVQEHPSNKRLVESKTVAIKAGDVEFNAAVEPERVMDISSDYTGQKFFQLFVNKAEDGSVSIDFDKWNRVIAFALNEEGVAKGLFDLGKSHESKEIIDGEIKNIQIDDKGVPASSPAADDAATRLLKSFLEGRK